MAKLSTLHWLLLALCIAVAAAALVWRSPARHAASGSTVESPLAVVPPGAALVLSIDLAKLAGLDAGDELVKRGAGMLGLGSDDCAARALARARLVALAVDGAAEQLVLPEPSEVALIATGDFDVEAVATCAERALESKKGEPVRGAIGSFTTVRDRKQRAGEVAVRNGGPLVISNGRYLRDILDAAEGKPLRPTELQAARDALHARLRQSFGRGAPVVATITLPAGWLERLLGDRDARLSPLSELRSAALRLEPAGEGFVLEALLTHTTPEAATRVHALLDEVRTGLASWLEEHTSARIAAQLEPRRDAATLRLSVHATREELERAAAALLP